MDVIDAEIIESMYGDGFRYAQYGEYERRLKGYSVFKIPLNTGFTCPNWDGRLSGDGCTYCPSRARQFTYPSFREVIDKDFPSQISHQINHYKKMGAGEKALVYIAFNTNTYAPIDVLEGLFNEVVGHEDVIGFTVGTRPDCLPMEVLDLIESYAKDYDVWIELGQQSMHYHTLREVNRQHGVAEFIKAVDECHKRRLKVLSFVILGLPYESPGEMMETARILSALNVDAIKLYPLVVMKGTRMAQDFIEGRYKPLGFMEYVNLLVDFLEHLDPNVLIQRLSKDCGLEIKLAPEWNTYRNIVTPVVLKILELRDTRQGALHKLSLSVDELKPLVEGEVPEFYDELRGQRSV